MDFPERLTTLRKRKGLKQRELAERVGVQVLQIRRYESGTSQPTLGVIRELALALGVTADELIFDKDQRGPDEDLRLQFEAISKFTQEEKMMVKEVLGGLILKHEARKWGMNSSQT